MDKTVLEEVSASVQVNCHISDARHGTEYGMCTYLMKMREYFRWEKGLGFSVMLGSEEVGAWLSEREDLWQGLEGRDYQPVRVADCDYDPLDDLTINDALQQYGLVYSGGIGSSGRTHFFLGELERREQHGDCSLVVAGREFARDLASPPAMTRENVIYVRRESIRRMLWEKLENWRWSRLDNPLGRAFSSYRFDEDQEGSLDSMTEHEIGMVLLHERGEHLSGKLLGNGWNRMLMDLGRTPGELAARAVRDHLADCMVTIPSLITDGDPSSLHFFIGNLGAMRKKLFPGLRRAYDMWLDSGELSHLSGIAEDGSSHWRRVAEQMLELHGRQGPGAADTVARLAEESSL